MNDETPTFWYNEYCGKGSLKVKTHSLSYDFCFAFCRVFIPFDSVVGNSVIIQALESKFPEYEIKLWKMGKYPDGIVAYYDKILKSEVD